MMKHNFFLAAVLFNAAILTACVGSNPYRQIQTTDNQPWQEVKQGAHGADIVKQEVSIDTAKSFQRVEGFGACFNELGWTSLSLLSGRDRDSVLQELFKPGAGASFNLCRMPVGANDFSRDWYSYNEKEGDFDMKGFSVANDEQTLIPFILQAKKYNPSIKIWASPWCPPSWMKYNKHYASAFCEDFIPVKYRNGLPREKAGHEGTDMFIQDERYFRAYALYFTKFIEAYRAHGINIYTVMPQNEFNSAQIFPSCCWTAKGLARFVGGYLGPAMQKIGVEVMFGTMERPSAALVDTLLTDKEASRYIEGVGFQWAGKDAVGDIAARYPGMKLYQTEQECGDGKNDWKGMVHSWDLLRHYFSKGVSAYMYWNISLEKGGISRWGWAQNSLVVVDTATRKFSYTNEYYLMKHISHFVKPGARRVAVSGDFGEALAFRNPDGSVVLLAFEKSGKETLLKVKLGGKTYRATLAPNSMNTILPDEE